MRCWPLRPPRFQPEQRVPHHDFMLTALLGQGGFGEVWSATQTRRTSTPAVAIKFCLDPELQNSLEREVRLLDRLAQDGASNHIVSLLWTALDNDPPFFVFEYVSGGDLATWIARRGRPASEAEVLRILKMTASGLRHAHERGVVHQDLKPSNLLMTDRDEVKIADFGIGHLVQTSGHASTTGNSRPALTALTAVRGAGTPIYADPQTTDLKQRDIYALGIVAYQLLVGDVSRPLPAGWNSMLERRGVSDATIKLVGKCLDEPSARFADAAAVDDALGLLERSRSSASPSREKSVSGAPVVISAKPTAARSRNWSLFLLGAVMTVIVVAVQLRTNHEAEAASEPTRAEAGGSQADTRSEPLKPELSAPPASKDSLGAPEEAPAPISRAPAPSEPVARLEPASNPPTPTNKKRPPTPGKPAVEVDPVLQRLSSFGRMSSSAAKALKATVAMRLARAADSAPGRSDGLYEAESLALFGEPVPANQIAAAKVRLKLYSGLSEFNLEAMFAPKQGSIAWCLRNAGVSQTECEALGAAAGRMTIEQVRNVGAGEPVALSPQPASPAPKQTAVTPQAVMRELNAGAIEAYNNMDINKAGSMLEEALRIAGEAKIRGPLLAETNGNLAVIYVGGLGDNDGGLRYFADAICADSGYQLAPLLSSPDIQAVFQAAASRVREQGCPGASAKR